MASFTRIADAAITQANLLMAEGSDALHAAVCGASDTPIGIAPRVCRSGEIVTIEPLTDDLCRLVASGAIAFGANVQLAANGRVATYSTGTPIGRAMSAVSAAGDIVDVAVSTGSVTGIGGGGADSTAVASAIANMTGAQKLGVAVELAIDARHSAPHIRSLVGQNQPSYITLPSHDGNGKNVHPSLLYFPSGLFGYKYWGLWECFTGADSKLEIPAVYVSNDGLTFATPAGGSNPLFATAPGSDFYADGNLVYANGLLYVFYIYSSEGTNEKIYNYISSSDGITWTAPVELFRTGTGVRNEASPSVHFDGSLWHWWGINMIPTLPTLEHREGATLAAMGAATPTICTLNNSPVYSGGTCLWHGEVREHNGFYIFVVTIVKTKSSVPPNAHHLATSSDGLTWDFAPQCLLAGDPRKTTNWDKTVYKPSVLWNMPTPELWYNGVNGTSYYIGRTPLKPIEPKYGNSDDARLLAAVSLVGRTNYSPWKLVDLVDRADSATSPGKPTGGGATVLSQTVTAVARASGIATITTSAAHGLSPGTVVTVDVTTDSTFDATDAVIATVPATNTFTYSNAGADEAEKSDTGSVSAVYRVSGGVYGVSGNRLYYISGTSPGVHFNTGLTSLAFEFMQDGSIVKYTLARVTANAANTAYVQFGFASDGNAAAGIFSVQNGSTYLAFVKGLKRTLPERFRVEVVGGEYYTFFYNDVLIAQTQLGTPLTGTYIGLYSSHANVKYGEIAVRALL